MQWFRGRKTKRHTTARRTIPLLGAFQRREKLERKRVLEAFSAYKVAHPSTRIKLPVFARVYKLLKNSKQGVTAIKRQSNVAGHTVYRIDKVSGLRTKEQWEEIKALEKGKGRRIEDLFDGAIFEEIKNLLKNTRLSYSEIADKAGTHRPVVAKVANRYNLRSEKERKKIQYESTAKKLRNAPQEKIEELLLKKERFNGRTDFSHSLSDVARMLGISESSVSNVVSRLQDKRTEADNYRVGNRNKAARISEAKSSPTQKKARELMSTTLMGSNEIVTQLREFDLKTIGRVKGNDIYAKYIYGARHSLGLSRLARTTTRREVAARGEFNSIISKLTDERRPVNLQNILENRNGQLTPQIAKDFFVEFLLRKRNLDPFQISAQIGLEQDYIIGIKRKLAKK